MSNPYKENEILVEENRKLKDRVRQQDLVITEFNNDDKGVRVVDGILMCPHGFNPQGCPICDETEALKDELSYWKDWITTNTGFVDFGNYPGKRSNT